MLTILIYCLLKGITGLSSIEEIEEILAKYGIYKDGFSTKVEIWGTGQPRREFLYSEDMADACVFLLENRDFNRYIELT